MLEVSIHSHLAVHRRFPFGGFHLGVAAVRLHDPGVDGVPQLQVQNAAQLTGKALVVHTDAHFHPAVGIAGQEVTGRNVDVQILSLIHISRE